MVLLKYLKPEVINTVRGLILRDKDLQAYMELFDKEISRGLNAETWETAKVKTIITHVNKLPNGKEEGQFLGLDFSGPIIKVMLVKLQNRECQITKKLYDIPQKYMTGKSEKVFDFIAKSIVDFMKGIKLKMRRIPLGVTFGFPIEQTSLQDCKLLKWTQGFQCKDLVGENVFLKLKNSIRKFPELKRVYVIGILNDSVSAVLACAWQDPSCMIAAVIGPGSSITYAEKAHRVTRYETESYGIRDIYMNLQSYAFGEDGCLDQVQSYFDKKLDEESKNPGQQINDKLMSSAYFGELARLVLVNLIERNLILNGALPKILLEKNSVTIKHLQRIESDPDHNHDNCRLVLNELGFIEITDEDCFQVQFVCRCISRRSANLVAAQLSTIINRINAPTVSLVLDGDSIINYPKYKWYLTKKLKQLKLPHCNIVVAGESGLGPAVMAAVFGEEIMDRDEKLRRLPGFPMEKCHFGKTGKCLNPDCRPGHPCDLSKVNQCYKPMTTTTEDLYPSQKKKDEKRGGCGGCKVLEDFSKVSTLHPSTETSNNVEHLFTDYVYNSGNLRKIYIINVLFHDLTKKSKTDIINEILKLKYKHLIVYVGDEKKKNIFYIN